jgi:hypothetical protein
VPHSGRTTRRQIRLVPLTDFLEKLHSLLKRETSSALPCAEPVLHSLDYRIELVSFRNRIGYG